MQWSFIQSHTHKKMGKVMLFAGVQIETSVILLSEKSQVHA